MKKAKLFGVIIPVLASAFLIGGTTQETKAASTYSTTETYYGAGYYEQDSTYNMQMQANFGGSGTSLNAIITGYTTIKSASSTTSSDVVSISSNAYATADNAISKTNSIGGYGNGGSASASIKYTVSKTAKAQLNTHTNHTKGAVYTVYLFYKES